MIRIRTLLLASVLAAGMLWSPGFALAQSPSATLHVLSVGISDYTATSGQRPVPGARNDASDLANFWKDQGARRFRKTRIATLINEEATRNSILAGLDKLVTEARGGDWAIVALAGHGSVNIREGEWCFAPYDTTGGSMVVVVSAAQIRERMAVLEQRGVTVILIVDSCQSGELARGDMHCVVLAACQPEQFSGEAPYQVRPNGYFTAALLEGMAGAADRNGDGQVSLAELREFLAVRLANLSHRQRPALLTPLGSDIALTVQPSVMAAATLVRR